MPVKPIQPMIVVARLRGAPTATPTEIILAKVSASPTTVVKLLQTGISKSFMYWIPVGIMLLGLLL